jgi:3-hydroxyacyl-[acyl-carrier-protein] dehydratase
MIATRDQIEQYIPQRKPFVMVHELLQADEESVTTQFQIEPDNILVEHGELPEAGLIENMAQTAAAHAGYNYRKQNLPVPIGYIASVKDLQIFGLPKAGSTLTTTVRIVNHVLNVIIAQGSVKHNNDCLCKCELRIFLKNN